MLEMFTANSVSAMNLVKLGLGTCQVFQIFTVRSSQEKKGKKTMDVNERTLEA